VPLGFADYYWYFIYIDISRYCIDIVDYIFRLVYIFLIFLIYGFSSHFHFRRLDCIDYYAITFFAISLLKFRHIDYDNIYHFIRYFINIFIHWFLHIATTIYYWPHWIVSFIRLLHLILNIIATLHAALSWWGCCHLQSDTDYAVSCFQRLMADIVCLQH